MHFTGPYAVDAAWKAFYRLNHGCPARAAAATSAHGGGARDDAGARRVAAAAHWHAPLELALAGVEALAAAVPVRRRARGHEGILGWLGVNRSADCAHASLDDAASRLGLVPLTRRIHSAYPCNAAQCTSDEKYPSYRQLLKFSSRGAEE